MKIKRYILPALAVAMLASGCDDQVMEWRPSDSSVKPEDLPLKEQEAIDNYDYIKSYVQQYHPYLNVASGVGADLYLSDAAYKALVDNNFTGITLGNAMKFGVIANSSGVLNFTTVDAVLAAMPQDMKLYGHNLLWHTQQPQTYLKSLIAPEMKIEASGGIANMLSGDAHDFNGGTTGGWGSWGSNKDGDNSGIDATGGEDGSAAMKLTSLADDNAYSAQFAYTFATPLDASKTYVIKFKAKSSTAAGQLQFQYQNSVSYGSQGGYTDFNVGTSWQTYQADVKVNYDDVDRIIINFGKVGGTYWLDDIEFGEKVEGAHNYCENGDFSDGTTGWTINGAGDGVEVVSIEGNPSGNANVLKMTSGAESSNAWDLEVETPKMPTLPGKKINMTFYVMSDKAGKGRCAFNGLTNSYPWMPWLPGADSWTEAFETVPGQWHRVSLDIFNYNDLDFAADATEWSIKFDFGYLPGVTYYLDDVQITEVDEAPASVRRKAGGVTYIAKSAEEKKTILLGAMEKWIKEVCEHMGTRVDAWDVINEPIADGGGWRGIDGVFGSSNNDGEADAEPEESAESGLNLHWASETGNQHWYWGYYLGKDYAVKAFEFARRYSPHAKLFVNDYNLETNPTKLRELIEFVKYIDANGGQVDGIGTQMHVQAKSLTREQVDEMFKTMAATGKLVRITELDVALGTANPSVEEQRTQADCYKMIIESYLENVPEAQRSAITIWGVSDNKKEHEYWLNGDTPNLFDADYGRKLAYKAVCDALAGYNLADDLQGSDWKKLHENDSAEETPEGGAE